MLKVCEILRVGLGLSHAKCGSSEGSTPGKRHFAIYIANRGLIPCTVAEMYTAELHVKLHEHAPFHREAPR